MSETPHNVARTAAQHGSLDLSNLALIGLFSGPDKRAALIRTPAGNIHRLTAGDVVAGLTVAGITDEGVQLATPTGVVTTLTIPGT